MELIHLHGTFATIASLATGNCIQPVQTTSSTSRNDMVERQVSCVKALRTVLTVVFISEKDVALGEWG